ncbi:MAG: ATP-binding cassette domain-containing protein [Candidatus Omnitrophica bacterium]|nr:ATP-binding cassette domain-containing protein [Candidatus Omnitrophota bacterium]
MIRVEAISKSFGDKKILDRVSFTINRGETFLIIGRSGAGKTVLLRSIVGLIKPDSGSIFIDGKDITKLEKKEELNKIRESIGIVFQGNALFDFLTVGENVGFVLLEKLCVPYEEIRESVRHTLNLVGLSNIEDLYPYELSGGMKKRVAIARAIIYKPQIVIYDEPTTGVDPIAVDKIVTLIEDLHKKFSVTSIIVTHDLQVGLKLADRLAFLLGGRIIFEGSKDELRELKDERVVQFLRGSSEGPIKETEV